MPRQIMFRAKVVDDECIRVIGEKDISFVFEKPLKVGSWVYGSLDNCFPEKPRIIYQNDGKWRIDVGVSPETICEYTGVNDKTNKPIFENDIITVRRGYCGNPNYPDGEYLQQVTFSNGYWNFLNGDAFEYEIMGNTFDNPELVQRLERDFPHYLVIGM